MISIVIPHFSLPGTDEALVKCIKSLPPMGAQLLIQHNEGGYAQAVNQGMAQTTGDWIFIINNDTEIISGQLETMLHANSITVPQIIPLPRDNNPRCFFCVPRKIYEEVKNFYSDDFYDERFFPGFWEDDDLIKRLELLGRDTILVDTVLVHHKDGGGLTIKQLGEQESYDINKKRFEEKWDKIFDVAEKI